MPSIGTSPMAVRLKDESISRLKETAERYDTTVAKILDSFTGVTPDYTGALSDFMPEAELSDIEMLGVSLIHAFLDAGVPEHEIRKSIERIKAQITPYSKTDWA